MTIGGKRGRDDVKLRGRTYSILIGILEKERRASEWGLKNRLIEKKREKDKERVKRNGEEVGRVDNGKTLVY